RRRGRRRLAAGGMSGRGGGQGRGGQVAEGARLGAGQCRQGQQQQQRDPAGHPVEAGAVAVLALAERVQVHAAIQVQQHRRHHYHQLGGQPGAEGYERDQHHAQGDGKDSRRRGDAEEQQVGDGVEVGRVSVAAAALARREQPRQEEQPAEPHQHRADVQQLEPEIHARFLAARQWRQATRGDAKRAWGSWRCALLATVLVPEVAAAVVPLSDALPVCRAPGGLAQPWSAPGLWLLPPLLLLGLYVAGVLRLWRSAPGRGITGLEAGGFLAGVVVLGFILGGPLNAYAGWSLA